MALIPPCQCCLLRSPDKDIRTSYKTLDKTEIYGDMLKECFDIDIYGNESGICEVCITRLRDAYDFKTQVQECQRSLQAKMESGDVKVESLVSCIKEEIADPEDDIFFLDVKSEYSDMEENEEENHKQKNIKIKDTTRSKRTILKKNYKNPLLTKSGSELPKKKLLGATAMKIRGLSQIETMKIKIKSTKRMVSEHKKHHINFHNVLKYSNCTPFSNKTIAGIVCAFCKESLPDLPNLRNHIEEQHNSQKLKDEKRLDKNNISFKVDISNLKCKICDASIDVISNLKKHLTKEHDIKFFLDIPDYILEFKLSDDVIFNCALCHSTFETFKMLLQHMNGHYRNCICDVCDMGFINKHRLKNHQRTHEVGNFKCSYCDKVFSTRVRKTCHEKYTHNTSARYTTNCPHCAETFTSYYRRNRHMHTDHNIAAATYRCNICDKSFILKSKLTSHIKKVHLMERNHICAVCGQGFFIKQSLDEHMIKHNGERVFKCTVCEKAYARKKTLREHMRIHNNDRRFKCGVCGSAFVQKCSLKSHMLSNHGITLTEYEAAKSNLSP